MAPQAHTSADGTVVASVYPPPQKKPWRSEISLFSLIYIYLAITNFLI